MGFLWDILGRPKNEKPVMIVVAGHPAANATTPAPEAALSKNDTAEIASWF